MKVTPLASVGSAVDSGTDESGSNTVKVVRKDFLEEKLHTEWRCSRGRAGHPISKGSVGTLLHPSLCRCVLWQDTTHTASDEC